MRAQRAREAESRVEMQAAKWTAEGALNSGSPGSRTRALARAVGCDVGHTSVAGDVQASRKARDAHGRLARHRIANQGGTAGHILTRNATRP